MQGKKLNFTSQSATFLALSDPDNAPTYCSQNMRLSSLSQLGVCELQLVMQRPVKSILFSLKQHQKLTLDSIKPNKMTTWSQS